MLDRFHKPLKYGLKTFFLRRSPGFYWGLRKTLRGAFEPECKLLSKWCRPGSVAIDVGANWGAWTHELLKHVGRVEAFEPMPRLAAVLRKGLPEDRVKIHEAAVSNVSGTAHLRVPRLNLGYSTIESSNKQEKHVVGDGPIEEIAVPLIRIDDLNLENVSFLKMDVEGHEIAAIEGALDTIRRCRPTLVIESETRHNAAAPPRLIELIRPFGYRVSKLVDGKQVEIPEGAHPDSVPGRNLIFEPARA